MKNGLFLLIDALRYDVVANMEAFRFLAPNLHDLALRGSIHRVVTNAQTTQFVMPSLFTETYPLDYDGYNDGIVGRPASFVELLKAAGWKTFLMATANQLGLSLGYQRGFDVICTTSDYRTQVEYRINRTLRHDLEKYRSGKLSADEAIERVRALMIPLLDGLVAAIENHDRTIWPPALEKLNLQIAAGCRREKKLLIETPQLVLRKLLKVAPGLYWRYMGATHVGGVGFFWRRALSALNWRSREKLAAQTAFPFLLLQHYQAIAGDVLPAIRRFVEAPGAQPWFAHVHLMDLHDCRSANRFWHVLGQLRYLPRWLSARRRGLTRRRFLYDAALMYVDDQMRGLLDALRASLESGETVLLVTGDHGSQYAESPRSKPPVGERMHYEHIEVPMILSGPVPSQAVKLIDSMGVTDSFLTALGVTGHPSFRGIGVQRGGRDAVITESCGAGFADLENGRVYYAISNSTHRLFMVLDGAELTATGLYDRHADPQELRNIVRTVEGRAIIRELSAVLYQERGDFLRARGAYTAENVRVAAA